MDNLFKVWVIKDCLSYGIYQSKIGVLSEDKTFYEKEKGAINFYYVKNDYALTFHEAELEFFKIKDKKIKSLVKKIDKINNTSLRVINASLRVIDNICGD